MNVDVEKKFEMIRVSAHLADAANIVRELTDHHPASSEDTTRARVSAKHLEIQKFDDPYQTIPHSSSGLYRGVTGRLSLM